MAGKLKFGADATVTDIQDKLRKNNQARHIEFDHCPTFGDSSLKEVLKSLNKDLNEIILIAVTISNSVLKVILEKCPQIRRLKFENCSNVDEETISLVGRHLPELNCIEFIYDDGATRPLVDDALSVLVKHCACDLNSIRFIGFTGITDIGVEYVTECFSNLTVVDFGDCRQISDKSLLALASSCRLLRDISLANCSVSDPGVLALAERCIRLVRVCLQNCDVHDTTVVSLVAKCSKLEALDFSRCQNLTDIALSAVLENCKFLYSADFSGTLVRTISRHVVCPLDLHELKLNDCPGLSEPETEVTSRGLDGILDHYKESCLAYRLKVFVAGPSLSGKTTLLDQLLCGVAPRDSDDEYGDDDPEPPVRRAVGGPTEGVDVRVWYPFRSNVENAQNGENLSAVSYIRDITPAQRNLRLEFWDLSGRDVCWKAHHVYLTSHALYIIVFDLSDVTKACADVLRHIKAVQYKIPGAMMMLVATYCDRLSEEERSENKRMVMTKLLECEKQTQARLKSELVLLKKGPIDATVYDKFEDLEYLLYKRPRLTGEIICVSNESASGLDGLRKVLLRRALDIETFPHLCHYTGPNVLQAYEDLRELSEHTYLLPWRDYKDVVIRDGKLGGDELLETESYFMHATGVVLDMKVQSHNNDLYNRFCALRPAVIADCICKLLVDDPTRNFKFESRRFWPSGSPRPKALYLAKVIEDIPSRGLVRETLTPLLWQEYAFSDDQIQMMLQLLPRLGILVPWSKVPEDENRSMDLPAFPGLSSTTQYSVSVLGLLPEIGPQLNWTEQPSSSDLQITCRYEFPTGSPAGMMERLLAVCSFTRNQQSYQHVWRTGMLLRIGQAWICITYTSSRFDIAVRLNRDGAIVGERKIVNNLWLHLSLFAYTIHKCMQDWRGLPTKEYLLLYGSPFYHGEPIREEHQFELCDLVARLRLNKPLMFYDKDQEREVDIELLFPQMEENIPLGKWLRNMLPRREALIRESQGSEAMQAWIPKIELPSPPPSEAALSVAGGEKNEIDGATQKKEIRFDLGTNGKIEDSERNRISDGGESSSLFASGALRFETEALVHNHDDALSNGSDDGVNNGRNDCRNGREDRSHGGESRSNPDYSSTDSNTNVDDDTRGTTLLESQRQTETLATATVDEESNGTIHADDSNDVAFETFVSDEIFDAIDVEAETDSNEKSAKNTEERQSFENPVDEPIVAEDFAVLKKELKSAETEHSQSAVPFSPKPLVTGTESDDVTGDHSGGPGKRIPKKSRDRKKFDVKGRSSSKTCVVV